MAGFSSTPSNYPFLKKLRAAKKATLKPCPYLKPTTVLRDYQVIGVLHFLSLARMILGDGVGLGKCVTLDTLIYTSKGLKKLKEFIPNNPTEDTLYPYTGDNKLLTIQGPVKPDAVYYCGVTRGLKIKTQEGYELSGLRHHPVYAPLKDSLGYRRLDRFKKDDYICINRKGLFAESYVKINYPQKSNYKIPDLLKEELAELLGFYISQSQCSDFPPINEIVHNRVKELLKLTLGCEQKELLDPEVTSFLTHLSVSDTILCSPESVVTSFMDGYIMGGGAVDSKKGMISCSSKTEDLINHLQLLLLNLGVISKRKVKDVVVGEISQAQYTLSFSLRDFILSAHEKKRNSGYDEIPIGRAILEQSLNDVYVYIKKVSDLKGYSANGTGWRNTIETHLKKITDGVIYYDKKCTYSLLDSFIEAIDDHNLKDIVSNYSTLKLLQDQNFYFDKIASIKPIQDTFADFHVPVEHNFMGNGFVNHNTLQMITSFAYRLMAEPNLKLIVVTPKSAMAQWAEEFEKFCTGIKVHILTNQYGEVREKGPDKKMMSTGEYGSLEDLKARGVKHRTISGFEARKAQYQTVDAHVMIINYFAVQEDYRFLIENRGPVFQIAFDECQEFKNMKTKTWFGASELSSAAKYCYGMSATIIKNRLEEAYYIYRVVVPGLFPGKIKFFAEYTVRKKMTRWQGPRGKKGNKRYFNKIVGYKNLAQFKETIDPFFLIRRTRDVADELPRLISRKLQLEMSEAQEQLYRKALSGELYQKLIKEKYFKFEQYASSKEELTDKEEQTYELLKIKYEESLTKEGLEKNKIAALSYCQLVSNGPGWLGEDGESSKETEFRRLFEQELADEKVIVFTRFKSGIKRLSAILNDLGLKYVQITGDNTIEERRNARKEFQDMDKDCNIIFITQAGSAAINLQAAGVILYYDTPWSYGDLYQSIGRAQRIGSIREHILLLHMVNVKTIDEHVLGILDSKKDLINQIVGDIAEGALAFKDDELLFGDEESSVSALFNSVFK